MFYFSRADLDRLQPMPVSLSGILGAHSYIIKQGVRDPPRSLAISESMVVVVAERGGQSRTHRQWAEYAVDTTRSARDRVRSPGRGSVLEK